MNNRKLDVFVHGRAHAYSDTPLTRALEGNESIRRIIRERWSTNGIDISNVVFVDPNAGFWMEDKGYSHAASLIKEIREQYPLTIVVICSNEEHIKGFLSKYGDEFSHYYQLDYEKVKEPPDLLVDKIVGLCQQELERNIRIQYEYDIAFSFAGEDRLIVEEIAEILKSQGAKVFYDKYEESNIWGKNLYDHLAWVYKDAAQFCVMFLSEHYKQKLWTSHERQSAQSRAFLEQSEYILPIKLDDTSIPGMTETIAYISIRGKSAMNIAKLIQDKLQG